jgi:hypothetical protein
VARSSVKPVATSSRYLFATDESSSDLSGTRAVVGALQPREVAQAAPLLP